MSRIEIHRPPQAESPSVEVLKKRDIRLLKKALGKSASQSLKARSVKEALHHQKTPENTIELQKNQLETAQKALGAVATERGLTNILRRRRARSLVKSLQYARHELT